MLPYKRSQRVGDLLREEIADIVIHRLKDPRIGFVTITGVDVTDDIKISKIYVSILRDEDKKTTLEILNSAKSFIRSELSKRLRMKSIPSIEFILDASIEYGNKIDKLLKKIEGEGESTS
ncbi:MAG: ribosome-binding factor A [Nitrospirae bacterium CG_4_10_14_0_8_um_filter_41_23]|nr:30S ribosome-binding factor RbfA [Nitrospirota bacterium]PIQ93667.1 MAG: ribosome-binding factor A [Nitrospirae bacterium CG11_big_fil_rev_8_21_14_0_20_41_14]PIV44356.1 MAG: ribosome-binding factor A [Nitrospirae bacterium CG02_land_8_20_14_3_00_41_53]PIW87388.1 MAG: ribosome-binding factor A [Nitrospirae bacterium CG_4_8_14_3_um_filter_41_47]PIY87042.1 MAG: ribosome-binding factor A [Nitrospirae bacterium CG_4_10_14_0_8_um_filter_41_23]PJA79528.1 MAG: ribosome-binding factor A [Nitrospirae